MDIILTPLKKSDFSDLNFSHDSNPKLRIHAFVHRCVCMFMYIRLCICVLVYDMCIFKCVNIYMYMYTSIQILDLIVILICFIVYYTAINAIPPWVSKICHQSIRKYICGTNFLYPQEGNFTNMLKKNNFDENMVNNITKSLELSGVKIAEFYKSVFYLPSYPEKQICVDYEKNCDLYIHNLLEINTIEPNCSTIKNNVILYPTEDQTVVTLDIDNITVNLQTRPNTMEFKGSKSSVVEYQTICPEGCVVCM
jgi:hypothetical protein